MKLAKPSHISLISRYILEFSQINSNWLKLFLFSKKETGQNSIIIVRFPYCPQYLKYLKERYSINYTYTLLGTIYFMKANMGLKKTTRLNLQYSRTTTLTNDHPSHTTTFRVTNSAFCLYTNPSRATIPLIRPHQCDSEGGRKRGILLYLN